MKSFIHTDYGNSYTCFMLQQWKRFQENGKNQERRGGTVDYEIKHYG